jgi:DNA sulfur modification protein DndD
LPAPYLRAFLQPLTPKNTEKQLITISQLNKMSVGPFRGFARQEVFDLGSRLVLIYGPNGTGKSSFCEALEYSLLGNVIEAENRRFPDQSEYLKNAYVNQFREPSITGKDEKENVIEITPNEGLFRFCFVEKNRIDSFSRIAAHPPAKQTELISILFGLESFTEFVRNFTNEIEEKYIDLIGKKTTVLQKKRESLSNAEQQIKFHTTELEQITSEEEQLAAKYKKDITFNDMVIELNGTSEIPGAIRKLEEELQQAVLAKRNLTMAGLEELNRSIEILVSELEGKQQELNVASQELSFKQLLSMLLQNLLLILNIITSRGQRQHRKTKFFMQEFLV